MDIDHFLIERNLLTVRVDNAPIIIIAINNIPMNIPGSLNILSWFFEMNTTRAVDWKARIIINMKNHKFFGFLHYLRSILLLTLMWLRVLQLKQVNFFSRSSSFILRLRESLIYLIHYL